MINFKKFIECENCGRKIYYGERIFIAFDNPFCSTDCIGNYYCDYAIGNYGSCSIHYDSQNWQTEDEDSETDECEHDDSSQETTLTKEE